MSLIVSLFSFLFCFVFLGCIVWWSTLCDPEWSVVLDCCQRLYCNGTRTMRFQLARLDVWATRKKGGHWRERERLERFIGRLCGWFGSCILEYSGVNSIPLLLRHVPLPQRPYISRHFPTVFLLILCDAVGKWNRTTHFLHAWLFSVSPVRSVRPSPLPPTCTRSKYAAAYM